MIVHILNQKYEINNKEISAEEFLLDIQKQLEEKELILSYLRINQEDVYDSFSEIVIDHWQTIEQLDFITRTYDEHVMDILITSRDYLGNAIPIVKEEADEYYKSVYHDNWMRLKELFEGIQWMFSSIESIRILNIEIEDKEFDLYMDGLNELQKIMPDLLDAMESEDTTLIGDLLKYELIPIFEGMYHQLVELLKIGAEE